MGPLDDLDALHVEDRKHAEVDGRTHAAEDAVSIEEHQHAAAHAARDSACPADVHLARVEGHALRIGKRFVEAGDIPAPQLVAAHDCDAHGGLARLRVAPVGRHGHARHLEQRPLQGQGERCAARGRRIDRVLKRPEAGGHHDQVDMVADIRQLKLEGAIRPCVGAQLGGPHEHLCLRDSLPRIGIHHPPPQRSPLLPGRGRRNQECKRHQDHRQEACTRNRPAAGAPPAHDPPKDPPAHRYCRCQTVVDTLIAGSVTSTVSTLPTSV